MPVKKPPMTQPQLLRVEVNKLWSPSAYAKKVGVERATIYNWIESGQIPPHHVYDANGSTLIYHP